jgi:hypothetical protein
MSRSRVSFSLALSLSLAACAPPTSSSAAEGLADTIVDAPGATHDGYGDPTNAIDGVRGGGWLTGSTNVYSLTYTDRPHLVVRWSGRRVTNGPGADLVVFENAFRTMWDDHAYFMDPVVVAVSLDATRWVELPHHYVATDPAAYSMHLEDWEGFAGVTPVIVNDDTHPMSWFDPGAGGDAFDLDELPADGDAGEIRAQGFRFVRVTSAAIVTDPDTDAGYPHDPVSNGADIDGIAARAFVADP